MHRVITNVPWGEIGSLYGYNGTRDCPLHRTHVLRGRKNTPAHQLKRNGNEMRCESTNTAIDSELS